MKLYNKFNFDCCGVQNNISQVIGIVTCPKCYTDESYDQFINLTPHDIVISDDKYKLTVITSGFIARIEMEENFVTEEKGFPVIKREIKGITGLPYQLYTDMVYIVSSMVLGALKDNPDYSDYTFYAPDTGNTAIRDDKGHIIAVTRLVSN